MPSAVMDRLFQRFSTMYGKAWLDMWAGIPIDEVKATWGDSLRNTSMEQIRLALDAMDTKGHPFPPSLPEFRAICEQYRVRAKPSLYLTAPRTQAPAEVFKSFREILEKAGK